MALTPRKIGEGLYEPLAAINVTPLVDVMLVLLIIFMVTAPMLATGIKVNLPSARTAQPLENKEPVVVGVAKDGAVSVGKDPVSRDELAARVKAKLGNSNGVVQLRGDRDAPYGDVVSVMDDLAASGISRIAIVSGPRRPIAPGSAAPDGPASDSAGRAGFHVAKRAQAVTAATLDGRVFEHPPLRPPWLRPAVIAVVLALHAAALSIVYLEPRPVVPPPEIVVEVVPEAPAAENPTPPAEQAKPPEQSAPPPGQATIPAPAEPPPVPVTPPVAAQPQEQPPAAAGDSPAAAGAASPAPAGAASPTPAGAASPPPQEQPPPPPQEQPPPPQEQPPPPRPVEAEPPKPVAPKAPPELRPPERAETQRPEARPEPRRAEPRPREESRRAAQASPGAPSTRAPSSAAASASSLSAYRGEVSAIIRSRLLYPEAARARGARGTVGVSFAIGPSGAVTSFAITRSSRDRELDAAARSLVEGARFPPPPGGSARIATSFSYAPH